MGRTSRSQRWLGLSVSMFLAGRPYGGVDEVLHPGLAGEPRDPLALLLFAFDAGLPGVLHGEHTPGALERRRERRDVVEVPLEDLDALGGERLSGFALRFPRQGAQLECAPSQVPQHGSALLAGRPGDQERSLTHRHLLMSKPSAPRRRAARGRRGTRLLAAASRRGQSRWRIPSSRTCSPDCASVRRSNPSFFGFANTSVMWIVCSHFCVTGLRKSMLAMSCQRALQLADGAAGAEGNTSAVDDRPGAPCLPWQPAVTTRAIPTPATSELRGRHEDGSSRPSLVRKSPVRTRKKSPFLADTCAARRLLFPRRQGASVGLSNSTR